MDFLAWDSLEATDICSSDEDVGILSVGAAGGVGHVGGGDILNIDFGDVWA